MRSTKVKDPKSCQCGCLKSDKTFSSLGRFVDEIFNSEEWIQSSAALLGHGLFELLGKIAR